MNRFKIQEKISQRWQGTHENIYIRNAIETARTCANREVVDMRWRWLADELLELWNEHSGEGMACYNWTEGFLTAAVVLSVRKKAEDALNENETMVLEAMIGSSAGNGHDFGFIDEIICVGMTQKQIGGYLTQLQKKGYVFIYVDDDPDKTTESMFIFTQKGESFLNQRGHKVFVNANHM